MNHQNVRTSKQKMFPSVTEDGADFSCGGELRSAHILYTPHSPALLLLHAHDEMAMMAYMALLMKYEHHDPHTRTKHQMNK